MSNEKLAAGHTNNADRCVFCGEIIPEGRMVCLVCEKNTNMTFGERLKKIRLERGYSQNKLAKIIGVEQCSISLYEVGRKQPTLDRIEWLCKALGVSATELLGF